MILYYIILYYIILYYIILYYITIYYSGPIVCNSILYSLPFALYTSLEPGALEPGALGPGWSLEP
jgi:hypothetical protein